MECFKIVQMFTFLDFTVIDPEVMWKLVTLHCWELQLYFSRFSRFSFTQSFQSHKYLLIWLLWRSFPFDVTPAMVVFARTSACWCWKHLRGLQLYSLSSSHVTAFYDRNLLNLWVSSLSSPLNFYLRTQRTVAWSSSHHCTHFITSTNKRRASEQQECQIHGRIVFSHFRIRPRNEFSRHIPSQALPSSSTNTNNALTRFPWSGA